MGPPPNTEMWVLVNNRMRATNAVLSTPLIEASKSSQRDQHHKISYMAFPFFLFSCCWQSNSVNWRFAMVNSLTMTIQLKNVSARKSMTSLHTHYIPSLEYVKSLLYTQCALA